MGGIEHHEHAGGFERGLDRVGELLAEPFLQLRAGGDRLERAGQIAQARDAIRRERRRGARRP